MKPSLVCASALLCSVCLCPAYAGVSTPAPETTPVQQPLVFPEPAALLLLGVALSLLAIKVRTRRRT